MSRVQTVLDPETLEVGDYVRINVGDTPDGIHTGKILVNGAGVIVTHWICGCCGDTEELHIDDFFGEHCDYNKAYRVPEWWV